MSIDSDLTARVQSWIAQDPDPITKTQLAEILFAAESDHAAWS
jgi:hypothetical protein